MLDAPLILCTTGSYGSCAITTTCATHTQLRHQRAELRRILPASTGDYQSRIFHHRSFFSSLQVSRDHYCREKTKRETSLGRPCVCSPAFSRFTQFELLQLELVFTFYVYASAQTSSGNRTRAARLAGEQPLDHYRSFYQIFKSFDPKLGSNFPPVAKFGLIHSLAQQTVTTLQ